MRNFDENNITAAVLERLENAETPRVRAVSEALVRHLHDFIREIEPTFEEWEAAIEFLTDVGKICTRSRQEFILLSDTLGASMLVDAINHRLPKGATETTVLGPFFVADAPALPLGADISPGMPGEPLFIEGSVRARDGRPLPGATIDVWHSDKDGYYDVQHYDEGGEMTMRARFAPTRPDASGSGRSCRSFYPIPDDGPVGDMLRAQGRHPFRPAHVHFMISAPGYETLVTHVFIDGDKYLDSDVVFGVKDLLVPQARAARRRAPGGGKRVDHPFAVMAYDFALAPRGAGLNAPDPPKRGDDKGGDSHASGSNRQADICERRRGARRLVVAGGLGARPAFAARCQDRLCEPADGAARGFWRGRFLHYGRGQCKLKGGLSLGSRPTRSKSWSATASRTPTAPRKSPRT